MFLKKDMKIKIFPIFFIAFFLIIFVVFYKGLKNSNLYKPEIMMEKKLPLFKANLFDSINTINSKEIFKSNKYYLINIWASWCVPCRDEHFFLMELSESNNLDIIGINYKDKIENSKKFLKEFKSPYRIIISDLDGTLSIELGAYGVPESFLIYDKKIIKKIIGPIDKDLSLQIQKLIK